MPPCRAQWVFTERTFLPKKLQRGGSVLNKKEERGKRPNTSLFGNDLMLRGGFAHKPQQRPKAAKPSTSIN